LAREDIKGAVYLVGGAVMCLVFNARPSTRDIDAHFEPSAKIRRAASRVAKEARISDKWLNDAVKAYLSPRGDYAPFLALSHLQVMTAQPEYLLAMKCLAMRIGEDFHDLEDVRFLLRYLNIESYGPAIETISRFYPVERFPQKTLYALEELLGRFE
jgi:hypothetical protein